MRIPTLKPRVPTADVRRVRPPPKIAEPFYSSADWLALRDRVRAEAGGRCQRPGCSERGLYVDHIVEIKDGGARLDRQNCELLCAAHHQVKTHDERAKRAGLR